MNRITLADTDLTVSTFCLGCMPSGARRDAGGSAALADQFRDAGGNFFDTAHCYCFWEPCGDGASERLLGDYVKQRGCRDEVVVATKGGHPSAPGYRTVEHYLTPGRVAADIDDSLARLQMDAIDLYWLHRDDPRVEVGAVLDMLNGEVRRGRIRFFGGSNWTSERLAEANAYAAAHGINGFVGSQPRWSLLRSEEQTQPERLEPGVMLHVSPADRAWHAAAQLPVIPYSPTGNGFFAQGGTAPESFRTPGNLGRAQRAATLAAELEATPNQVALAWLLHQPFPVLPILGTSRADHLADALAADTVTLTPEQVDWLEQGEEALPPAPRGTGFQPVSRTTRQQETGKMPVPRPTPRCLIGRDRKGDGGRWALACHP